MINTIFTNWRKTKLNYQNELRIRLETEKEASSLMQNITKVSLNKAMLKDLFHMCTELMGRTNIAEK